MIEAEESVKSIIQQIIAIRNALGSATNEEIICAFEKTVEKKATLDAKEYDELRDLLKLTR
jgi:DNA-binding FrmR family transcriptional regulator